MAKHSLSRKIVQSSSTRLQEGILQDSEEINQYYRRREGDYARFKAGKMLGRMATKYTSIKKYYWIYFAHLAKI